jgi:hypothetical protein
MTLLPMRMCWAFRYHTTARLLPAGRLKAEVSIYGVGAGTGISGFRANLGVGDDLFGSREDAYSETVRQKRWDWYQDDFSARLKPDAKRILMNTRWHEDDVAGRVLEVGALHPWARP